MSWARSSRLAFGLGSEISTQSLADLDMRRIVDQLAGGDLRSIGASNRVVVRVLAQPVLFAEVMAGLGHPDRVVRSRCADAAEKISARQPGWLKPYKAPLLQLLKTAQHPELRWHLAQMIPRLDLGRREHERAVRAMYGFLDDESRIVATMALQALFDLSKKDAELRERLRADLRRVEREGAAAIRARARSILRDMS